MLDAQVLCEAILFDRRVKASKNKVEFSVPELGKLQSRRTDLGDVQDNARMFLGEPLDGGRKYRACDRLRTPNADFPRRWVGKKLDVSDPLFKLVESRLPALEQRK